MYGIYKGQYFQVFSSLYRISLKWLYLILWDLADL